MWGRIRPECGGLPNGYGKVTLDYRARDFPWQQRERLQACPSATLTRTAASHAEADETDGMVSKPLGPPGRVILPRR
jgi:hypothetical protein